MHNVIPWLHDPQGYRDALAWLLKNGKIPIGFAGADTADTADSSARRSSVDGDVPAWRQRIAATLASMQVIRSFVAINV